MARIFFIGSIPDHEANTGKDCSEKHHDLINAARQLGSKAVARGHKVLIGSDSPNTIDKYIMEGILDYCKIKGNTANIEIHRPEKSKAIFTKVPENLTISRIDYESDTGVELKWVVSHVRALDSCDIVILLGGGKSTKLIGNIAADRQIPVISIPTFKGTATIIYEKLRYYYKNILSEKSDLSILTQEWGETSAEKIIGLAETLYSHNRNVKPHTYFISYNWDDISEADNVEVLLLRNHRLVNRDERSLTPGTDLNDSVKLLIEESDTFLGLYSKNFKKSSWCPNELTYSLKRQKQGLNPKRVILIKLDDTDVPITFEGKLHQDGKDRNARELAILRLIKDET